MRHSRSRRKSTEAWQYTPQLHSPTTNLTEYEATALAHLWLRGRVFEQARRHPRQLRNGLVVARPAVEHAEVVEPGVGPQGDAWRGNAFCGSECQ